MLKKVKIWCQKFQDYCIELCFSILCYYKYFVIGCDIIENLKKKILEDGEIHEGNILKVDGFLNHQIDVPFLKEIGKEFYNRFKDDNVNKILTIESSGIAIATMAAQEFACPLVFAKKSLTKNIAGDIYLTPVESFTHGTTYGVIVSKEFLGKGDRVLILDDFLAVGNALNGLIEIVKESGAELVGCGAVIEKGYQGGGDKLREQGIKVESLAVIESMDCEKGTIEFRD